MSRKTFRSILVGLLILSGGFATWAWFRPYDWSSDPQARCKVLGCQVLKDHANYWVNLQLKVPPGGKHDLQQPVRLLTANGQSLEPADTTLEGDDQMPVRRIWLKFWLDEADLKGPLRLQLNDGELTIRSGQGLPKVGPKGSNFVSHRW